MVEDFVQTHQVGPNMHVVATGNVDHAEFMDCVQGAFAKIPQSAPNGKTPINTQKQIYTPSEMTIRDDDHDKAYFGLFFNTPGHGHETYPAWLLLQRLMGDYDRHHQDKFEDNNSHQHNFHRFLWEIEQLETVQTVFTPYSDSGLFGFQGVSEDSALQHGILHCMNGVVDRAHKVWDWEQTYARNQFFNELLGIQDGTGDTLQQIMQQLVYQGRRVTNTELAERVTRLSPNDVRDVVD